LLVLSTHLFTRLVICALLLDIEHGLPKVRGTFCLSLRILAVNFLLALFLNERCPLSILLLFS